MTLTDFFWGLGDIFYFLFQPLDADGPWTFLMNTALVLLGFVGLGIWLLKQKKFNEEAAANPGQLK